MQDFTVIIPARYASERLPRKCLLDIVGKPMIQRVYEQAIQSSARNVIVATDDQRIFDVVQSFGGDVCMTADTHNSGTDRLQEVAASRRFDDEHVVVNVQGDEPLIPPQAIDQVARELIESRSRIASLAEPIVDESDFRDPNVVKVVIGGDGGALYFSRAPIPWPRDESTLEQASLPTQMTALKHLGIYAYQVSLLNEFIAWMPTTLEQTEKLEQLRAMWHGVKITIGISAIPIPAGVDTEHDLQRVIEFVRNLENT